MVDPKKQDFWPRINILKGNLKKENPLMNYGSSKSAKMLPIVWLRALRGGGVRASDWLSKGRRFESRLRRFFTPTPAESLPFLTPPLAETVN